MSLSHLNGLRRHKTILRVENLEDRRTPSANAVDDRTLGINFGSAKDYTGYKLFADAALTARYGSAATPYDYTQPVDAAGNPNASSFGLFLADNWDINGRYALSFNGTASNITVAGGTLSNLAYNVGTNTTTGTIDVTNTGTGRFGLSISFFNASRTPGGAPGVTNLHIMRPKTPGSLTSYAVTDLFVDEIKTLASSNFNVIRSMGLVSSNGDIWQKEWADRVLPGTPQALQINLVDGFGTPYVHNKGVAWEYVIAFANQTQTDMYISIPVAASNDYIQKLAQLIKTNLDPARKVYVELSNELWNFSWPEFEQGRYALNKALAEPANSPIRYDGEGDWTILKARWSAKRTLELSNILRGEFGDSAMGSKVRVMFNWQIGNSGYPRFGSSGIAFLHDYYNNGEGNFVANPKPVNYYVWGGGGTTYYEPDTQDNNLTIDNIWNSATFDVEKWNRLTLTDIAWAKSFGLAAVSYEGGPQLQNTGHSDAVKAAAWYDNRIGTEVIEHLYRYEENGGDFNTLFLLEGNRDATTWEFVHNPFNPTSDSPKFRAIDLLNDTTVKRSASRINQANGSPFLAATYAPFGDQDNHPFTDSSIVFANDTTGEARNGAGGLNYLVNAPAAGTYKLKIRYSGNATRVALVVNGEKVGTYNLPASAGATDLSDITVTLNKNVNGIRIQNLDNTVTLYSLTVTQDVVVTPPTDAPGGLKGEYFDNIDFTNKRLERTDAWVAFNWGGGTPAYPQIANDTFSIRWTGSIRTIEPGTYSFRTFSDEGVRLWINGQLIIDNFTDHTAAYDEATISLAVGTRYDIRLDYKENTGAAQIQLQWKRPGRADFEGINPTQLFATGAAPAPVTNEIPGGLRADLFRDANLGTLAGTRVDTWLEFNWGTGSPLWPTIPVDNFSIRWTGGLTPAVGGNYTLKTTSDEGVRVYLDGVAIIDNWTNHTVAVDTASVTLVAGRRYDLKIEYKEVTGLAQFAFQWQRPGQSAFENVNPAFFSYLPPPATNGPSASS